MNKEQNPNNSENLSEDTQSQKINSESTQENSGNEENKEKDIEKSPEEKILELEDKLARTFAEMENQRRRFEKEKDDAFDYGGFSLARETLNLIDNLERSKLALENDENLKNSEPLKKTLDHLNIIQKDMISIKTNW